MYRGSHAVIHPSHVTAESENLARATRIKKFLIKLQWVTSPYRSLTPSFRIDSNMGISRSMDSINVTLQSQSVPALLPSLHANVTEDLTDMHYAIEMNAESRMITVPVPVHLQNYELNVQNPDIQNAVYALFEYFLLEKPKTWLSSKNTQQPKIVEIEETATEKKIVPSCLQLREKEEKTKKLIKILDHNTDNTKFTIYPHMFSNIYEKIRHIPLRAMFLQDLKRRNLYMPRIFEEERKMRTLPIKRTGKTQIVEVLDHGEEEEEIVRPADNQVSGASYMAEILQQLFSSPNIQNIKDLKVLNKNISSVLAYIDPHDRICIMSKILEYLQRCDESAAFGFLHKIWLFFTSLQFLHETSQLDIANDDLLNSIESFIIRNVESGWIYEQKIYGSTYLELPSTSTSLIQPVYSEDCTLLLEDKKVDFDTIGRLIRQYFPEIRQSSIQTTETIITDESETSSETENTEEWNASGLDETSLRFTIDKKDQSTREVPNTEADNFYQEAMRRWCEAEEYVPVHKKLQVYYDRYGNPSFYPDHSKEGQSSDVTSYSIYDYSYLPPDILHNEFKRISSIDVEPNSALDRLRRFHSNRIFYSVYQKASVKLEIDKILREIVLQNEAALGKEETAAAASQGSSKNSGDDGEIQVNGYVSVNPESIISVHFFNKTRVDISVDLAVRISIPRLCSVIAISATGSSMAIIHPTGRVFQCGSEIEMLIIDETNQNNKYAKIWRRGISFKSDKSMCTYLVDSAGTSTCRYVFSDLQSDFSFDVFYSEGRHGQLYMTEAIQMARMYRHWVGKDYTSHWVIHNIKIEQKLDGSLCIRKNHDTINVSIVMDSASLAITSPEMYVTCSLGKSSHFFLKTEDKRIYNGIDGFSVRNAGQSAGYDANQKIMLRTN